MKERMRYFQMVSKYNGGVYAVSERKYMKNPEEWEPLDNVYKDSESPIIDKNVDMDLNNLTPPQNSPSSESDLSYFDIKSKLTDKGVEFKGNASKKELKKLLESTEE